ncbi:hypothetical protein [Streptomyces halobius]|uniref:Uncharacterized protein n=1 Tax=Streptomyces halobius TaxID=2879846 RepID=A0ABY4ME13_9ACTN|nr:hypothetical protein [Streptomyces halobius]UQA94556.1 hypothetical protein K9S39_24250 [Streptomyces halobius]
MSTVIEPETVAERAREILEAWQADEEFGRLWEGCAKYSSDWDDFYGYPIVENYDAVGDAPVLFKETTRAMALKSAMYELTDGDEKAAELPLPVPVDVMSHALMAQFTLLSRMQDRTGIKFVHMTDMEEGQSGGTWDFDDFTHQCYRAAFGPVNIRFWIGKDETERRRKAARRPVRRHRCHRARKTDLHRPRLSTGVGAGSSSGWGSGGGAIRSGFRPTLSGCTHAGVPSGP